MSFIVHITIQDEKSGSFIVAQRGDAFEQWEIAFKVIRCNACGKPYKRLDTFLKHIDSKHKGMRRVWKLRFEVMK